MGKLRQARAQDLIPFARFAGALFSRTRIISWVTVQVVKTGITPQRATSDRLREAEKELLHPVGRLHMRR